MLRAEKTIVVMRHGRETADERARQPKSDHVCCYRNRCV